ncbi:hypothetical protein NQ317_015414 [Molorchus minor]|uniref:Cysteine and histidine-rich domain-containing protein n=1 Tax=Molorchus minor TaxID=1323400 RepID=A0ABQ9IV84_9CUCU|nr:hypothetical protein NQ317_015414 [Molorchus minor]
MPDENPLLQCYNRGCGQKYDPNNNKEDSCRHHPGQPVFHDAYKGWSCCNKKCTDFTEFLNIKGCAVAKHSDIKPPEPEKPAVKAVEYDRVVEVTVKPEIAPALKQQLCSNTKQNEQRKADKSTEIAVGTTCKNGGCQATYEGPQSTSSTSKKSSLEDQDSKQVQCRWDFHQTGSHVVVAIYAKQYCPMQSVVKLSPVRLSANLVFPQQSNECFSLDMELRGIINVEESQVSMYGTKVEIKMKKAEPGSWVKLGDPVAQPVAVTKKVSGGEGGN